ncbi:uncharacterized protein LOC143589178 [Bidens hawaiensis]|uniref:uncharacterized protein LOC143589178 n=1 Tax=Bidens hawaiensis TaxID=980011 RepID=UPI00404B95CE
MEELSVLFLNACEKGMFQGLQLPNSGPFISNLLFADDAIMLGEWSLENVNNLARILRIFHIISGLTINLAKSCLIGVEAEDGEIQKFASILHCKVGSTPFVHLGVSVGANMNRYNNWQSVFDVFNARLTGWKASSLSIGGHFTLLKSMLESIPTYYFSIYKAPTNVIEELEAKRRNFMWGSIDSIRKTH